MENKGFIFDLDGVIVDTAHFHFLAWRKTAAQLGFELTPERNELLKGVSRIDSLHKILEWADKKVDNETFNHLAHEKNNDYLSFVSKMTRDDVLPGVYDFIKDLKAMNAPVALGSASKNAKTILEKTELLEMFTVIVDGNSVTHAKPDPEVFLTAAKLINTEPSECFVFEDSVAGVTAANLAGMISIGIGKKEVLGHAQYIFSGFTEINIDLIEKLVTT
ncbi:beta-phosphoglucomutase [Ascidiimonas aurantiaca]|uniref:beta-phosphoglucomutase n=1 Tax=Ascidiimonas aurantiaca TaxID=1685432 RepID=UPI0030EB225B